MPRSIYEPRLHPRQKQRCHLEFRSGKRPVGLNSPPKRNESGIQAIRCTFDTRGARTRTREHTLHVRANPLPELAY